MVLVLVVVVKVGKMPSCQALEIPAWPILVVFVLVIIVIIVNTIKIKTQHHHKGSLRAALVIMWRLRRAPIQVRYNISCLPAAPVLSPVVIVKEENLLAPPGAPGATWHHLGITWTTLGHYLGQLGVNLAPLGNWIDNTWAPLWIAYGHFMTRRIVMMTKSAVF